MFKLLMVLVIAGCLMLGFGLYFDSEICFLAGCACIVPMYGYCLISLFRTNRVNAQRARQEMLSRNSEGRYYL